MIRWLHLLVLLLWPLSALAALPPAALNSAGVSLPPDARLPLTLASRDIAGHRHSIAELLAGKPGFVLFADYTCSTLCGPALVLLGAALIQGGLAPDSWHLIVIGLDPKDSAADARKMMLAQVPEKLRAQTAFLLPDSRTLSVAVSALGFHYVYDRSVDQFAHPEVVYVVSGDGRVLRLLSPLALTAGDIRTAFSKPQELPQTLYGRLRVLCYRFGLLTGVHTAAIELILQAAAAVTLIAMAGALFLMLKRRRPA